MIISKSAAHSIKSFRKQNKFQGSLTLIGLISGCIGFIILKNTFYQLIFLAELIIANFLMLVVFINQYLASKQQLNVLSMCFLISETERANNNQNLGLEQMIDLGCLYKVSTCSKFYTRIKIAFHNNCCESKDIFYFILSAGVIVQLFFEQSFQSDLNFYLVGILCLTSFCELTLTALGIFIEMPRRIRQYYKMKILHRRASQVQFQVMQSMDNGSVLFESLLENEQQDIQILEPQADQRQQQALQQNFNINNIEEKIQCQICFEELEATGNIQQLHCHPTHIFHSECISNWFQKKFQENLVPSCPICRAPQNQ
ncbi:unnamed protein product [Paramecium sonneborni]|uniref:RING-type domain-containing protein n=1 Tax=Paramecium sonneborni TaxID=65129 RepID=A0A8S1QF51_9CILI|nr:unnamed protein product [Paramecium sonneborni]